MSAGRSVNSLSRDWCTPPKYVEAVREMFGGKIALDPCSNRNSVVRADREFIPPKDDGLAGDWNYATVYVNPPYGADRKNGSTIRDWLRKCSETRERYGSEVLALIPVATNTSHWKKYVFGSASSVCFLYDTRLKFLINGNTDNKGAPMSCCMVYWGDRLKKFGEVFSPFGAVVDMTGLIVNKTAVNGNDIKGNGISQRKKVSVRKRIRI